MPHVSGRSASILWCAALCAVCACGRVQHPRPEPLPNDGSLAATACALAEPPLREADSAVVHFSTPATTREACALELIARELRPWPTSSNDRWAVRITLTGDGARAYRLDYESAHDAIDSGAALVATEDIGILAYAASTERDVRPLFWDRTYFWLAPGAVDSLGVTSLPDAVRAHARPAEVDPSCAAAWPAFVPDTATSRSLRVVYAAGDRTAQELAERIVAIVGGATVASPLDAPAFDAALRTGDELGYVVSLPRSAAFECDRLAMLAQRIPWLGPHQVRPLIDTRAHAIAPRAARPVRP